MLLECELRFVACHEIQIAPGYTHLKEVMWTRLFGGYSDRLFGFKI